MENEGIGSRILKRRRDLCLTQEELAARMGYKTKSSINKIEKGYNDVPRTKVRKFAEALHTTEDYLNGKTDNPSPNQTPVPRTLQDTVNMLMSIIPSAHIKLPDDAILEDDEEEDDDDYSLEYEDINKAFDLYKKYKNAIPPIQEAIRNLLKVDEPDT